ncbi:hypothetical protein KAI92_04625 [Candidatus Parcubacteria bacterium]|nr:hypothetical protein [Candidatus Parcubacteria bacterium]
MNNEKFNNADNQRQSISSKINRMMFGLFVIFVVLVGSMLFNYYSTPTTTIKIIDEDDNVIKTEKITKKPKYNIPEVIYNLTGIIEEVNDNYIILKVRISEGMEEYAPERKGPEMRKVAINSLTRFNKLQFTPIPGTTQKKVEEIQIPSSSFNEGDYIEVIASKDIAIAKDFDASQIKKLR